MTCARGLPHVSPISEYPKPQSVEGRWVDGLGLDHLGLARRARGNGSKLVVRQLDGPALIRDDADELRRFAPSSIEDAISGDGTSAWRCFGIAHDSAKCAYCLTRCITSELSDGLVGFGAA